MNYKEKTAAMRAALKAAGFNSKAVSVSHRSSGYSDAWNVTIRQQGISKRQIEDIVYQFEYIRWDEHCQEILEGCNDFVFVDKTAAAEGGEEFREAVQAAVDFHHSPEHEDGCGRNIAGTDWVLFYDSGFHRFDLWNSNEAADYSVRDVHGINDWQDVAESISKIIYARNLDIEYLNKKKLA